MKENDGFDVDPAIARALAGLPSDFAGFGRIFEREIRPALQEREMERIKAADLARKATWGGVAVGVGGAALGLLAFGLPQVAFLAGFAGLLIAGLGRAPIGRIASEAKALLVTPIARELSLEFASAPGRLLLAP